MTTSSSFNETVLLKGGGKWQLAVVFLAGLLPYGVCLLLDFLLVPAGLEGLLDVLRIRGIGGLISAMTLVLLQGDCRSRCPSMILFTIS